MANKNILLIEPGYKNKYPPLGLMKLAQYHGPRGKQDNVFFIKGEDETVLERSWDRIYITTLFSFEWKRMERAINFALAVSHNQPHAIFVGGIAASLMHDAFLAEKKWRGRRSSTTTALRCSSVSGCASTRSNRARDRASSLATNAG